VNIEIWSDIACPWCYVGKRRFEAALGRFEHRDDVTITWRSFELDPGAPAAYEQDGPTRLAEKYGMSVERARAMQDRLTEVAAGEGLDFRFDRARGGSTFDAHRMTHLAKAHGLQDQMEERLMRAYLTDGELISDPQTLERLAVEVGLPQDLAREVARTERYADDVRDDERTAAALGIHAVPFFVVDRRIAVSGAQAPEVFLELLRQASPAEPAVPVLATGDTCGVDGC
jgi:predicted DsbA family dithiol-disulfide isomerase